MQTPTYPSAAVEGAMKVQEVILRGIDGRVKWYQAVESLGISDACVAFIWLIPDQSETSTESTRCVFNKSIRIAVFSRGPQARWTYPILLEYLVDP
jgi:hypothetical protein